MISEHFQDEEEPEQENSIESPKEEVAAAKDNHEGDKVDSVSTEVIPEEKEEEVQKKEVIAAEVSVPVQEKKSQENPVEAMEVDSVPTIITTPPEPEVDESAVEAVEDVEEIAESPVEEINAAQENELNTAEEIKQNEINISSDESKVTQSEDDTNNHVLHPEEESVSVEQTESSGHCQTETEPPAANSDIVQTPQSCN